MAFIGPNGAGATTQMLAGLLHPTAGEAQVWGLRPGAQAVYLRPSSSSNRHGGVMAMITSHYMADVVACPRVILIHHGALPTMASLGACAETGAVQADPESWAAGRCR